MSHYTYSIPGPGGSISPLILNYAPDTISIILTHSYCKCTPNLKRAPVFGLSHRKTLPRCSRRSSPANQGIPNGWIIPTPFPISLVLIGAISDRHCSLGKPAVWGAQIFWCMPNDENQHKYAQSTTTGPYPYY